MQGSGPGILSTKIDGLAHKIYPTPQVLSPLEESLYNLYWAKDRLSIKSDNAARASSVVVK